ncbi:MAG TPA: NHL repeat-containing protein, partial [Stenomitos sp.]
MGHVRKALVFFAITLLLSLVTACPRAMVPSVVGSPAVQGDPTTVEGMVDFADHRRVQASLETIATGATVAIIRVSNGQTVATALTDERGHFVLKMTNGYRPVANELYYFEAIKGLSLGGNGDNAVGGSLVRVRTIAQWRDNQWATLSSALGGVTINQTTTALAIIVSLRSAAGFGPAIDAQQLLQSVVLGSPQDNYPDSINLPAALTAEPHPVLPLSLVQRTIDLVADALAKNRDPLRWIALSSSDPDHNTVSLPDAPFTISSLRPNLAAPGDTVVLVGSNFGDTPGANLVTFTDPTGATVSATVTTVSPDRSQLTLVVPPTAVTGPMSLTLAGKTLPGPMFNLAVRSGHGAVDVSGNVYSANKSMGTVSITQRLAGSARLGVKALVTGLDNPSALTFGKSGYPELYVACGGTTKQIFKIDVSSPTPTPVASSSVAPFANPSGIAYQYASGDYYISDASQNKLYKMAAAGPTPAVTAFTVNNVTLSQPRGLCFGPDGLLYVANMGANNVLAIDVSTGNGSVTLSGLASPYGVAFDNMGNFYVSNNAGNSVYTVPVTSAPGVTPKVYGNLTSFASLPTPGAMTADSSGYLYVADTNSNGLYRINQHAESYQVAYGLSYPSGIWTDASGHYILTDAGRILYYNTSSQVLSVFAEGLYSAKGLVRDGSGNFYTNQSSIASLIKIAPDGTTSSLLSGLTTCTNSGVRINGSKLYLRSSVSVDPAVYPNQGEVLEYDLNNLGSTPNARYKSLAKNTLAIARDQSGGPYNNYYYGVQTGDSAPSIVRINKLGSQYAEYTLVTKDGSGKLVDPRDIWVDPSGRIWVVDFVG